jgi:hypothetical protein
MAAMRRTGKLLICILMVPVIFSLTGCTTASQGRLKRVQDPTEDGLRQNWNEYTVHFRRYANQNQVLNLAIIYKIKNDSKIIIDDSWIEVTSDNMMNDTEILESTWVKKIIGQNDKMFGYLVHSSSDRVYAGILDENTIKLSYHYVPSEIIGQNDKMFGYLVYLSSEQVFAGIIDKTP